ncbi:MAG TPA: tetratricopeptide repeat protein [bacterium]|nr:tetratricopeptide repeat protein [bacterium]HEX67925.1 tetratricopeptide repeat protein [bacterium]
MGKGLKELLNSIPSSSEPHCPKHPWEKIWGICPQCKARLCYQCYVELLTQNRCPICGKKQISFPTGSPPFFKTPVFYSFLFIFFLSLSYPIFSYHKKKQVGDLKSYLQKCTRLKTLAQSMDKKGLEKESKRIYKMLSKALEDTVECWKKKPLRGEIKKKEGLPCLLISLAWAYYKSGNLTKAEQTLKEVLNFTPPPHLEVLASYRLGEVKEKMREYSEAIKYYRDSVKKREALKDDFLEEVLNVLADSRFLHEIWLMMVELRGEYSVEEAHYRIIQCLHLENKKEEAEREYALFKKSHPYSPYLKKAEKLLGIKEKPEKKEKEEIKKILEKWEKELEEKDSLQPEIIHLNRI